MKRELIDRAAALAGVAGWDWQELYLPAHFKQVIEDCPTVEERRRGRWTIEDCHAATYKYCCSNCGAHHRALYDYCPTCGARMDAEEKE